MGGPLRANRCARTLGAGEKCLPKGGDCEWGRFKCCSGHCITPAGSASGKPMCADAPATLTNMAPDVLYVENRTLGAGEKCLPKGGDCQYGRFKCCSGLCKSTTSAPPTCT